jgi:hypothetical protein
MRLGRSFVEPALFSTLIYLCIMIFIIIPRYLLILRQSNRIDRANKWLDEAENAINKDEESSLF